MKLKLDNLDLERNKEKRESGGRRVPCRQPWKLERRRREKAEGERGSFLGEHGKEWRRLGRRRKEERERKGEEDDPSYDNIHVITALALTPESFNSIQTLFSFLFFVITHIISF